MTWTLTCSIADCGTVGEADNPSFYTAPATVEEAVVVTLTATSNADSAVTDTVQITVTPAEVVTITSQQSEVAYGIQGLPYRFMLTTTGGAPGEEDGWPLRYSYELTGGTAVPSGMAKDDWGFLGRPASWGTTAVRVQARDSLGTTSTPVVLEISVSPAPSGAHNSLLNGQYLLVTYSGNYPNARVIGSIHADGQGRITAGTLELMSGNRMLNWSATTYSIGEDNRGVLRLPHPGTYPTIERFVFSVGSVKEGVAQEIDLIKLDIDAGPAKLIRQDPAALSAESVSGRFAFGFAGYDDLRTLTEDGELWWHPAVAAGSFVTGDEGNLTGTVDAQGRNSAIAMPMTGQFSMDDASIGRAMLHLDSPQLPEAFPRDFVVYFVDANRAFAMSKDPTLPGLDRWVLSGEVRRQVLPAFDGGSFSGDFVAYGVTNRYPQEVVQAAIVPTRYWIDDTWPDSTFLWHGTCDSSGACAIDASERQMGGRYENDLAAGALDITVESSGRFSISDPQWVGYLYDRNQGFLLDVNSTDRAMYGYIEAQAEPAEQPGHSGGTYMFQNMMLLNAYATHTDGLLNLNADGTVEGVKDEGYLAIPESADYPVGDALAARGLERSSAGEPIAGHWGWPKENGRFQIADHNGDITQVCYAISQLKVACISPGHPERSVMVMERGE